MAYPGRDPVNDLSSNPSSIPDAWLRVELLLNKSSEALEQLAGCIPAGCAEQFVALRNQHQELRGELRLLRELGSEHEGEASRLEKLRMGADRFAKSTRDEARTTYERLKSFAKDPNTGKAVKEGLGDIGRGAARAGREIGGAMSSAWGRFRQPASKPPVDAPAVGGEKQTAAGPDVKNREWNREREN
jgi:hypothetical protein